MTKFSKKQIITFIVGFVSLILFFVLTAISHGMISSLKDQQLAKSWNKEGDYAQISCLFTTKAQVSEMTVRSFGYQLESILMEESLWSEDSPARAFVAAYSGNGSISIANSRANLTVDAIGVGGDFFLFHPIELLSGTYFDGNMLMQDYIIIDEDAAWQLFGSYDIAGMKVMVGNVEHTIIGVAKRDQSKVAKAAGLSGSTAYISYSSLEKYGSSEGITAYEVVMPNPVDEYALNTVKDNLGVPKEETEYIENTERFSTVSLFNVIKGFGKRSMQTKAVIYPYWENIARYYEDVLAMLLVFRIILVGIPVVMLVVLGIKLWRRRTFTLKGVMKKLGEFIITGKDACIKKIKSKRKKREEV